MDKIEQLEKDIHSLNLERNKLYKDLKEKRANLKFLCSCGKMHQIKNCKALLEHFYVSPKGCTEGDYWEEKEIQILCPKTNVKNRIIFLEDHYGIGNLQHQFKSLYLNLFKSSRNTYGELERDKLPWVNNFYFEKNLKKFGLKRNT